MGHAHSDGVNLEAAIFSTFTCYKFVVIRVENWHLFEFIGAQFMVYYQAGQVKNFLATLWAAICRQGHRIDNIIMQDLAIETRCVLSGTFMTLFRVCMAIVLLVAIGFALDEIDIEYAARALARFLRKF